MIEHSVDYYTMAMQMQTFLTHYLHVIGIEGDVAGEPFGGLGIVHQTLHQVTITYDV